MKIGINSFGAGNRNFAQLVRLYIFKQRAAESDGSATAGRVDSLTDEPLESAIRNSLSFAT